MVATGTAWHYFNMRSILFNHNVILFTSVLITILMFTETIYIVDSFFMSTLFVIKILLYGTLNVENPSLRIVEIMNLPLTVIGNMLKMLSIY